MAPLVGLFALLGGALRMALGIFAQQFAGIVPSPGMLVTTGGSFLLGFLGEMLLAAEPLDSQRRVLFHLGLCGGFTTAAAYAPELGPLVAQGDLVRPVMFVFGSILLANVSLASGVFVARRRDPRTNRS